MKHIKMTALSKANGKWYARLEHTYRVFPYITITNDIIASGALATDGHVYTTNCSVVSDKPVDIVDVKNAISQQWRVFG